MCTHTPTARPASKAGAHCNGDPSVFVLVFSETRAVAKESSGTAPTGAGVSPVDSKHTLLRSALHRGRLLLQVLFKLVNALIQYVQSLIHFIQSYRQWRRERDDVPHG
jgi:hypothetical protein